MEQKLLEVCVDSFASAMAAIHGGADRLELCSALVVGGLTPSVALLDQIRKVSDIPVNCLMRPRFGDFCYDEAEISQMEAEIKVLKSHGASGFVIGVLREDGSLNVEVMKRLCDASRLECSPWISKINLTLHRAFDVCSDPFLTLKEAHDIGIDTILTSGQKNHCEEGADLIKELLQNPYGMHILIGSGVNASVIRRMREKYPLAVQFHLSAKKVEESRMVYRKKGVSMGLPSLSEFEIYRTDENAVREARKALYEQ